MSKNVKNMYQRYSTPKSFAINIYKKFQRTWQVKNLVCDSLKEKRRGSMHAVQSAAWLMETDKMTKILEFNV